MRDYHNQSDIFNFKDAGEQKIKKSDNNNNRETINDPVKPQKPQRKYHPVKSSVFDGENVDNKNYSATEGNLPKKSSEGQKVSEDNTLAHDFTGKPMRDIKPGKKVFGPKKTMETEPPERRGKKIDMKRFEEDPKSLLANNFNPKYSKSGIKTFEKKYGETVPEERRGKKIMPDKLKEDEGNTLANN